MRGTIGFRIGDKEFSAGPGDSVFKPGGVPHTFWNLGPEPARLVEIITPGAFAHYFEELGAILAAGVPSDLKRIGELDMKYGHRLEMSWVPTLLAKCGVKLAGD